MSGAAHAFKDERGYFTGREPFPRVPPASGFKVCSRCKDDKPVAAFSPDKRNPDGLLYWCRACRAEDFRVRRQAKKDAMTPEDNAARVWRMNPEMLAVKTKALLAAAREARENGMWRGKAAIRAYRNLGLAIEALHVPSPERRDAMDRDAAPCSCPEWPCPRHASEVQP